MSTPQVGLAVRWLRRSALGAAAAVMVALAAPSSLLAQRVVREPERVLSVSKGASVLLVNPVNFQRFAVGEPGVAEAVVVSPTELLINGKSLGTTTLIVWDNAGQPRLYAIEVTADAPGLERYLRGLLPDENIAVAASGNSVTLTGQVKDPNSVARAIEIAKTSGATVIDNLVAPPAVQVLLQVRFAEINQTAAKELSTALSTLNPHELSDNGDWSGQTVSDGLVQFLLQNPGSNLQAIINASISRGNFRSLAEPNLMTLPGKEASFLAGGEFPFPTIQNVASGAGTAGITIVFKDFGIKLKFTPNITRSGAIRLKVAPEVSSLDFANGLVISGFAIPTILTRRAETEVELGEGQYLAIAGLMDNTTIENVTKIPILGDIPILGEFFKSRNKEQRRTQLLVLVQPRLVTASTTPAPLPTGELKDWKWDKSIGVPKSGPPVQPQ